MRAFPDLVTQVDVLLTDGDRVVARWIASGTHEGPWREIAPTGNRVTWTGNTIFRISCGRIAEEWSEAASLAFFQQLGVEAGPPAPVPEATPDA
ncbi:MAG TPA: ester cyclase [Thermomicrobiales bacterium]|nr:ester cyclase [Thermomicrobiales bacterium]